ncbi:uncharacterized protein LOC116169351 [Photinus pyralis]|uniref:uncharacterized protein LOC116169351 n=1 Tax=Photinus pyralis TaxID=7054 RepID=UPI0012673DB7|nr:uncharacterized protein LOC116169351 [Photinus pyralis]
MAISLLAVLVLFSLDSVLGHGMMINPAGRSSRWRFNSTAPPNYNDMELFCGGFGAQWLIHGGKCGVCGDNYSDPVPRSNENTGYYGQGVIVAEYQAESIINVTVRLTQNHRGTFTFGLCELVNLTKPETEDCFKTLLFADGSEKAEVEPGNKDFYYRIQLPTGFKCDNCVLRWHYRTGNNYGTDEDGTTCLGCGPQEVFRTCADIAII